MSADREEYIEVVVAAAPPLRPEQISKLNALFDTDTENGGAAG